MNVKKVLSEQQNRVKQNNFQNVLSENSENFIKNPNSYQKALFLSFQQGKINNLEYLSELLRYDDFRVKKAILSNVSFEELVLNIEFKELINYLGEIHRNE